MGDMDLFYTVRVRVESDESRGRVSAQVMRSLFEGLGDDDFDVVVWPHDDSRPSGMGPGTVDPPVFG